MLSKLKTHPTTHYFILAVIIPLCVVAILVPYSLLLKWNGLTLFLFWFIIVPFVILFLTARFLKKSNTAGKSIIAVVSFYGFMVWMIYEHYQSDYFVIMMASFLWNLLILLLKIVIEHVDSRGSASKFPTRH